MPSMKALHDTSYDIEVLMNYLRIHENQSAETDKVSPGWGHLGYLEALNRFRWFMHFLDDNI